MTVVNSQPHRQGYRDVVEVLATIFSALETSCQGLAAWLLLVAVRRMPDQLNTVEAETSRDRQWSSPLIRRTPPPWS